MKIEHTKITKNYKKLKSGSSSKINKSESIQREVNTSFSFCTHYVTQILDNLPMTKNSIIHGKLRAITLVLITGFLYVIPDYIPFEIQDLNLDQKRRSENLLTINSTEFDTTKKSEFYSNLSTNRTFVLAIGTGRCGTLAVSKLLQHVQKCGTILPCTACIGQFRKFRFFSQKHREGRWVSPDKFAG